MSLVTFATAARAQTTLGTGNNAAPPATPSSRPPTRADILRGEYGPYRANNDLRYYDLDVRVDPAKKLISGKNSIRFRMLNDDTRIQIDLYANLTIEKIQMNTTPLQFVRELNAVFVDFPETLRAGRDYTIDVQYSGTPAETGRFGGFTFGKDPAGKPWITTACEGQGASIWWPNKDQWHDEPDGMELSVEIPSDLVDVSNGRFMGKKDLGDGFTRWDWRIHYPINSYNVSVNIGNYEHFSDTIPAAGPPGSSEPLTLDFYALPGSIDKARAQFAQAKPMIEAYRKVFGEYPFALDGYKLIEVPYSGMEHQSAVTYGNRFANGYLERDWTGVGVSLRFDFIIIHESAHEWFGNAVSAADVSDMWIQEGWTTYLEGVYVEQLFGYDDAVKYVNGYKAKVANKEPIITQRGIHRSPSQDQYFKGALFLHTLRSVIGDLARLKPGPTPEAPPPEGEGGADARWWKLLRDVYQQFKYKNIMTEELVAYINKEVGKDLTPIFDQYLRRADLPTLELVFNDAEKTVAYRWNATERAFAMPIKVGARNNWQLIAPTTDWQLMPNSLAKEGFEVATDLYYVNVVKH
jgi:aminopeptidase N